MTVVRATLAALALLVVALFGPPAVLGWVPLTVDDDASGLPAGSVSVVDPVDADDQASSVADLSVGDVVTVSTAGGGLATRTVAGVDDSGVTTSGPGGVTTLLRADRLRAVERYRLPLVGHVTAAVAPAQPYVGRLVGAAFLLWGLAEVASALRDRRRHPAPESDRALAPAWQPLELTATPATTEAALSPAPTRRSRARARRSRPWDRALEALAGAVGAVVLAARTLDHRHEDPREDGGRHRDPAPTRTVRATRRRRDTGVTVPTAPTPSGSAGDAATDSSDAPSRRTGSTRMIPGKAPGRATGGVWSQRPSHEEVARAARVQEFESRRIAAQTAMTLDDDTSPVDALLAQREANRSAREPRPEPPTP